MYEDYNYHDTLKDCAELTVGKWFAENNLQIVGTKLVVCKRDRQWISTCKCLCKN